MSSAQQFCLCANEGINGMNFFCAGQAYDSQHEKCGITVQKGWKSA